MAVFRRRYPSDEIACMAVALGIAATLRTVGLAVETTIHHAHCISHALNKLPKYRAVAIVANALRLQLESVREFVEQHAARFKIHVRGIVVGKCPLDMVGAIDDAHLTIATLLRRHTIVAAQDIVERVEHGDAVVG